MRYLFILVFLVQTATTSNAQNATAIIDELRLINRQIAAKQDKSSGTPCPGTDTFPLISNRAMNIFLADKTGYLSGAGDLSYFTNYVTLSSAGILTVNHNFQKAKGTDEPIRHLLSIGASVRVANRFNSPFQGSRSSNELGITLNQTWLGKVKTSSFVCDQQLTTKGRAARAANQKQAMDAIRSGILHRLQVEIFKKEQDFESAIAAIDSAEEVPGQSLHAARSLVRQAFYNELKEEYNRQFAVLQAESLTNTNNFKLITTHWTSLAAYVPVAFPKHYVAESYTTPFMQVHPYPVHLRLSHTRFWESSKAGRLFITLAGMVAANNSTQGFTLAKTNFGAYKSLGGTDTLRLAAIKRDEVYIGAYNTFFTPVIQGRFVYFPHGSHIGLSFLAEQNFGNYRPLNLRIGVPVILINSRKTPALNIEFQAYLFDVTHTIATGKKEGRNPYIGVSVGIPFSRLMY